MELKAREIIKVIKKSEFEVELTKAEREQLRHEDNFDCQSGGNKLEDAI